MIQWTSLTDIFSQMETKFTCVPGKSSVGRSFNDCIWIQSSLFFEQVVNPNSESLPIRRNWKRSVSNKGFATQRCLPVTALQAFHGSLATRFSPMLGSYCEDYWLHSGRETQAWCSGLLFFHTSVYKLESTHGWWWWKKLFPLVSFFLSDLISILTTKVSQSTSHPHFWPGIGASRRSKPFSPCLNKKMPV